MDDLNIECSGCGSTLTYSPGQKSLKCPNCKAKVPIPIPEKELNEPEDCDYIVPLNVTSKEVIKTTHVYMASGDYTPDDLVEKAVIKEQVMYYLPAYLFTGSFHADWSASFGFDRQETYTVYETRYKSVGNHRYEEQVPVTRTRTVTDWHSHSGVAKGSYISFVYAGALSSSAKRIVEQAPLKERTTFNKKFLVGVEVESFSILENDAYSQYASSEIYSQVDSAVKKHKKGDHQKDWHFDASYDANPTYNFLIPMCYAKFEYEGKSFNLWIAGYNSNIIEGDSLPIDMKKKIAVYKGGIPLALSVLAITIGNAYLNLPLSNSSLIALSLSGLYALLRRTAIIGHSKAKRNKVVGQRHAETISSSELTAEEKKAIAKSYESTVLPPIADSNNDKKYISIVSVVALLVIFFPLITGLNFSRSPEASSNQDTSNKEVVQSQTPVVEGQANTQPNNEVNEQQNKDQEENKSSYYSLPENNNPSPVAKNYGYMSFFYNPTTRYIGYSWNQATENQADNLAKQSCEQNDPNNKSNIACLKIGDKSPKGYRCMSITTSVNGAISWGVGLDGDAADKSSLEACNKSSSGCKIVASKCVD
jgi:LSD1 subclass zinc finger protein